MIDISRWLINEIHSLKSHPVRSETCPIWPVAYGLRGRIRTIINSIFTAGESSATRTNLQLKKIFSKLIEKNKKLRAYELSILKVHPDPLL